MYRRYYQRYPQDGQIVENMGEEPMVEKVARPEIIVPQKPEPVELEKIQEEVREVVHRADNSQPVERVIQSSSQGEQTNILSSTLQNFFSHIGIDDILLILLIIILFQESGEEQGLILILAFLLLIGF